MSGMSTGDIIKLIDSGATQHMTPHKHLLEKFIQISPKSINAANKHTFQAIRQGDMQIQVLNGKIRTKMVLKDVFYALDIAVMLISVGQINAAGYSTMFGGGACVICNKAKVVIG